jgi:hypothetical protein
MGRGSAKAVTGCSWSIGSHAQEANINEDDQV